MTYANIHSIINCRKELISTDIYEACPWLCASRYLLRQVRTEDRDDLLKVYSDPAAQPIFNSDNCTGDFRMTRPEEMEDCIAFWLREYGQRYYIRWSIVDLTCAAAIGTVELFHRTADDYFNHVGLLRLDLRSDYETAEEIPAVLSMLLPRAFAYFECDTLATKIPPCAAVRREALERIGFRYCPQVLRGHDGREYGDYYTLAQDDLRI